MNKTISSLLIKICILVGAFFLGLAARSHAQTISPGANPADTTHHRYGNHAFHRPGFRDSRSFRDDRGSWDGRSAMGFHGGRGAMGFHGGRDAYRQRDRIHYTPEQRQQVMAINKEYRQKAADLFSQDNITLKQYKSGLLALQKEKKDKLSGLLTQQQKDEQVAQRKQMTENRQVREAAGLERLKLRLNLSDDQVAKLKTGQESIRSQARAIHENDNLLPQEKMQQIKALMAKRNDTYRSVLTPDQYTQFEKMFHHRSGGFDRQGRHFRGPDGPLGPGGPGGSSAI